MSAEHDDKTSENVEPTQQTLELAVAAGGILRAIGRDDRAGQVVALLLDGHRTGTTITAIELMGALGLMSLEHLPEPTQDEPVIVIGPTEILALAPTLPIIGEIVSDETAGDDSEPAPAEPLPSAEKPSEAEEPAEVELSEEEVRAQANTVDFLKRAYPIETVEQLSPEQLAAFRQSFEQIVTENRQLLDLGKVSERHLDVAVLRAKLWMSGATPEEIINQSELNVKNRPALYASNKTLAGRVGKAFTLDTMLKSADNPELVETKSHQAETGLPENFKQNVLELLQHSPDGQEYVGNIMQSILGKGRLPDFVYRQVILNLREMVASGVLVNPAKSLFALSTAAGGQPEHTPGFRRHTPRQSQEDLGKMIRGAGINGGVKLTRRQRPGVGPDHRR